MVKSVLLDTSVLVAALVQSHPEHGRAILWLQRVQQKECIGSISAHSLAELYSVLTGHFRASPAAVRNIVETELVAHFQIVTLSEADYLSVLVNAELHDIRGGTIFDGIIACAAWKTEVDMLLTLNRKHFERLSPDRAEQIAEP